MSYFVEKVKAWALAQGQDPEEVINTLTTAAMIEYRSLEEVARAYFLSVTADWSQLAEGTGKDKNL